MNELRCHKGATVLGSEHVHCVWHPCSLALSVVETLVSLPTGINLPHALIMFMLNHLTSFSIKFYAKLYIWRIVYALLTRRALPIKEVLKDTLRSAFFLSSLGLTGLLGLIFALPCVRAPASN